MGTTTLRSWLVAVAIGVTVVGSTAVAAASAPPPCGGADTGCEVVRPGSLLMPMACTAGFLFKAGGHNYVSTAGHCAGLNSPEDGLLLPEGEERMWRPGEGAAVYDRHGLRIGEFAYAIRTMEDPEPAPLPRDADFALIRLDRGVSWSAQMCHFGGPTGTNADESAVMELVTLQYFGNTVAGGYDYVRGEWVWPARTAIANGMPDRHKVMASGHASGGDSGAPVTTEDGRAVGLLAGPPDDVPHQGHAGAFVVGRLTPQVARAEVVLGRPLRLITAPVLEQEPLGSDDPAATTTTSCG